MTKQRKLALALLVLFALILGGWLVARNDDNGDLGRGDEQVELKEGEVEVEGEIVCLPLRSGGGAQDEENCVKGLKGDDGKTYALNSLEVRGIENTFEVGTDVKAVGTFEPADTSNSESNTFVYDGVLVLSSLRKD